jgi:dienelactone hydrolase
MMRTWLAYIAASILCATGFCAAAETGKSPWDMEALSRVPKTFDDPAHSTSDVKAIFYEGLPWRGKPIRVFAYYGVPKVEAGKKVPAMVLVHGGGGSAFIPWVQLWVSRGYAAIAMDTCGCVSGGGYENHPRHEQGGPPGWGGLDQIGEPIEDQWPYHAVADVILAHSLIRSFPEVDAEKVGLTGISWGGYLTCIAAGVDHRFRFAAPVYGCGFLGDNSLLLDAFKAMGPEKSGKWLKLWDPSVYLPDAPMPLLWVTGTNDFAFPMDSLQRSYRLSNAPRTLAIRVNMPHGHGGPGENPEEIHAMADALLKEGAPLARITAGGRNGADAWIAFESRRPVQKAELNYTTDSGPWKERHWTTVPANVDTQARKVSAVLPEKTTVYYFNVLDEGNLIVSSEHEEVLPSKSSNGH